MKHTEKSSLLVGVYVDDLIVTGSDVQCIEEFKAQMKVKFDMSDLGLLSFYLGIEVIQTDDEIRLCQKSYALKILEDMGMADCNPVQTPMEARIKLTKSGTHSLVDSTQYRSIVGSLRYLTHTRPDIMYSVGIVSRFMETPNSEHLAAVKRILRYVKGTTEYGLVYPKRQTEGGLIGFSDSDHAGDIDDRKSTTGMVYFWGPHVISWASQKQKIVALSSCEAEYVAITSAACQGIWLSRLLSELKGEAEKTVKLLVDNKSAIAMSKNPVYHGRSKHIDTRYYFIRSCIEKKQIEVDYIRTEEQLADIFTKSLGRMKFIEMIKNIGLKSCKFE
ncbi:uncharacterized protein LOC114581179 [Dendrobium catenatum]|nr:uncharacterized protein LOC114581179 [Dendrobium catenatum]